MESPARVMTVCFQKVWQTSDDSISVIFESHEHAKTFMLQYHM